MQDPLRQVPPQSPCINVCVLGEGGHCLGCLRTGDEIAQWRGMTTAEQWALIDELARRRVPLANLGTPPDGKSNESSG